jgi:hypothetical protein
VTLPQTLPLAPIPASLLTSAEPGGLASGFGGKSRLSAQNSDFAELLAGLEPTSTVAKIPVNSGAMAVPVLARLAQPQTAALKELARWAEGQAKQQEPAPLQGGATTGAEDTAGATTSARMPLPIAIGARTAATLKNQASAGSQNNEAGFDISLAEIPAGDQGATQSEAAIEMKPAPVTGSVSEQAGAPPASSALSWLHGADAAGFASPGAACPVDTLRKFRGGSGDSEAAIGEPEPRALALAIAPNLQQGITAPPSSDSQAGASGPAIPVSDGDARAEVLQSGPAAESGEQAGRDALSLTQNSGQDTNAAMERSQVASITSEPSVTALNQVVVSVYESLPKASSQESTAPDIRPAGEESAGAAGGMHRQTALARKRDSESASGGGLAQLGTAMDQALPAVPMPAMPAPATGSAADTGSKAGLRASEIAGISSSGVCADAGSTALNSPAPQASDASATVADPGALPQQDRLAFALSVTPAAAAAGHGNSSAPAVTMLPEKSAGSVTGAPAGSMPGLTMEHTGGAALQGGVPAEASKVADENGARAHEARQSLNVPDAEPAATAQEPLRVVRVQFTGENNQRIDVRMGETGGQLRVTVKGADPILVQNLQDHLPELTSRLGDQHFHSEVWTPRDSEVAPAPSSRAGAGQSGYSGGQGQQNRRQQGQNGNAPTWIDDFDLAPRGNSNARRQ